MQGGILLMAARRTWTAAYSRHRTLPARLAKDGEMPLEQSGNHHCHRTTNVVAEYYSNEGGDVEQVSKSAQNERGEDFADYNDYKKKGGGTMLMLMMIIQIQQFVISC